MSIEKEISAGIDPVEKKLHYRPSASLIIAAQHNGAVNDNYDYKLLLFKRTLRTSYAPDHCVFPGGAFEVNADESEDWLNYFSKCGITIQQLDLFTQKCSKKRPTPLMTSGMCFSRDISLRITALRETFEEVGILLCRPSNAWKEQQLFGCVKENFDRSYWQRAVHEDPKQFLKLCETVNVVPDLWSLHEWSIWRTPVTAAKKFDTVFYFVALEEQPRLLLEESEVATELWQTPAIFFRLFAERSIWLPPPQYYELSRLTHAHKLLELLSFLKHRQTVGSTSLHPVYYQCTDGMVGVMPGDDFYPSSSSDFPNATVTLNESVADFRQKARRYHRYTYRDMYDFKVDMNIPDVDSHLSPIMAKTVFCKL